MSRFKLSAVNILFILKKNAKKVRVNTKLNEFEV